MKKILIGALFFASISTFASERMTCEITTSDNAQKSSLNLTPVAEIEFDNISGDKNIDFEVLDVNFRTKSFSIYTSRNSKREILVSASIDTQEEKDERTLEVKVNQKHGGKYLELGRFRYHLDYSKLVASSINYETLQFAVYLPDTNKKINLNCRKY